jgi:hypothetical protein
MPADLEQKKSYLDALSIGFYVVGALAGLLSCLALIYVGLGGFMLASPGSFDGAEPPPPFVGCLVLGLGLLLLTLGWGFAGCMISAGRALARRRKWTFVVVMAAVSCIFTPVGTVLGVLAIVLLVQPDVKALFEAPA